MDFMGGGNGSDDEHKDTSNSERGRKHYHRHSPEQIHHLEAFFKECPHPDEKQRCQLSKDLGLEPKQIKFWFQNKRTQIKAQAERADNNVLRAENEKIHCENLAMKDALNNLVCPRCSDKELGEEDRQRNLQKLRTENALLKREFDQLWNIVAPFMGNSSTLLSPPLGSITSSSEERCVGQEMGVPFSDQEPVEGLPVNLMAAYQFARVEETEKSLIIETAAAAMQELLELLRVNEPIWIKTSTDERYFLDSDAYSNCYPKINHFLNSGAWVESSKDSGIVPMNAVRLMEILSDPEKWVDVFPTIVTKVKTFGPLDTGSLGGSLHLIYAKLHILSPLVKPREYLFLRHSCQLNSSTWAIVDTSYDCLNKVQVASLGSWRLPSGCMIQQMPNGKAKVTWVEHVQVDGKSFSDPLFKQLIWSCQAFGAKRWIVTLERMCQRLAFSVGSRSMTTSGFEGVIDAYEGRKTLMDLSHRMVKNFCEILTTPRKLDFGYLTKLKNSDFQVSVRENRRSGQPHGMIVCVAASLWLPVMWENLFSFFKDEKTRTQWDTLFDGSPVNEIARIATGAHSGNCISVLKPLFTRGNGMLILQESCVDPLGGLVIYSPIDLSAMGVATSGEDISRIPILPSGFVISSDGCHPVAGDGASTSGGVSSSRGSILTMVLQIIMSDIPFKELSIEMIETIRIFMSTSIAKVKVAIGCPDLD